MQFISGEPHKSRDTIGRIVAADGSTPTSLPIFRVELTRKTVGSPITWQNAINVGWWLGLIGIVNHPSINSLIKWLRTFSPQTSNAHFSLMALQRTSTNFKHPHENALANIRVGPAISVRGIVCFKKRPAQPALTYLHARRGGWGELTRPMQGKCAKAGAVSAAENAHTAPAFDC